MAVSVPIPVAEPVPAPAWDGWSKAPVFARLVATFIDAIIMEPLVIPAVFWIMADSARGETPVGGLALLAVGGLWMFVYAYIKDGMKGASLGKRIMGLMVVSLKDNRPAGVGSSILRALVLNFISAIEAIIVVVDPRGRRLGDKIATTQVVRMAEYEAAVPGWVRPGKAMAIVLLILSLLMGSVGGIITGLLWVRSAAGAVQSEVVAPASGTGAGAVMPDTTSDPELEAATRSVSDFYAAINAADMEAIKAVLVPDLASQADPGAFEGWTSTTFEFTRGWIDSGTAYVIGRESQQAYGAGSGGGVKFELTSVGGTWLIKSWQAVDATQVEGSETSGSSSGIPGPLSDPVARDLVTQLLKARQSGAGNVIRRLATKKFLDDNGAVWLDGIDNSEYFTAFKILSVRVTGGTATVTVSETWPDGVSTSTYGLIESGGFVLADSWVVK